VIPRDGLRVRFHVVRDNQRLHMELDHDGFAREQAIVVSDTLDRIQFVVENRTGRAHDTGLTISGLPAGEYTITVDGRSAETLPGGADAVLLRLPISSPLTRVTIATAR
jgi:hypothetical protein